MKPPIHTRFNLIWRLTDTHGVELRRQDLWQVPLVGQTIGIDGNPYRVIDVGWSLPDAEGPELHQFAYVKVQKASDFTVTIGGRDY